MSNIDKYYDNPNPGKGPDDRLMYRKHKTLKNSDALDFEDVIDRGDFALTVKEQWNTTHTVRVVTNLADKHPDLPWRIWRFEEDLWYTYDQLTEEWVSEEYEDD